MEEQLIPTDTLPLDELETRAAQGDAQAACELGRCYLLGHRDAHRDEARGVYWLRQCGSLAASKLSLAWVYTYSNTYADPSVARALWEELSADGWGAALTELGRFYERGEGGLTRDEQKALELYEEAANRGDPDGLFELARILWVGRGLPADPPRALALFEAAAARGNQFAIAFLHRYHGYVEPIDDLFTVAP